MVAKNDITGDNIQTKGKLSAEGEANWDAIFPPKKKERYVPPPLPGAEVPADQPVEFSEDWQSEERATAIAQNGNVGYSLEEIYDKVEKDYRNE